MALQSWNAIQNIAKEECKIKAVSTLREQLEKVTCILNSAQWAGREINAKLFIQKSAVCESCEETPSGDEVDFLVNKILEMASRLESNLAYINDKL